MSMQSNPDTILPSARIPLCVPEIRGNEWKYIKHCLDTGWVSSVGSYVTQFEEKLSRYVGAKHAIAAVNGTSALHIALLCAGVRPDDEVLVSTLTFIAPVNAIRYVGAWPVFMDADRKYWQMDPEAVRDFLAKECRVRKGQVFNRTTKRRVAAILPVHILGHPVDMDPIMELTAKYKLAVIEDATEALGALYKNRMVGTIGHIACFSFNGNKLITTGGGGMIVTNKENWARRARYLTTQAKDDPVEYCHKQIGYNYRLTNIQAAMGVAQIEQIREFVAKKRAIADRYMKALGDIPGISFQAEAPWARSAWWMFTIRIAPAQFGRDSRATLKALGEKGVETRPLWQPMHISPAHKDCPRRRCPIASALHRTSLSLPCSVGLDEKSQDYVIGLLRKLHAAR